MNSEHDLWWGYHNEQHWVVFDRDWVWNKYTRDGKILIVRCSDWIIYEEDYSKWKMWIDYRGAKKYLETLSVYNQELAQKILLQLQKDYEVKRESMIQDIVSLRHYAFLEKKSLSVSQREIQQPTQGYCHRTANCWGCNRSLDNAVDFECAHCHWIVCWHCGACGCGWPLRNE